VHGETFDVVDENDCVVGRESRFEVHRRQLKHRAVHVFVFSTSGELFLQKRSRWKDVCPMRWDSSVAGHVNSGDNYTQTAHRELQEERGISSDVREVASLTPCLETGHEFVVLFETTHDGPFELPPSEIEFGEWFTIDQIKRWTSLRPDDFAPGFLKCWFAWLNPAR
jgi:16S rRNA (adenine1518-N6/adenine1519-N6)-dimethyltransferase